MTKAAEHNRLSVQLGNIRQLILEKSFNRAREEIAVLSTIDTEMKLVDIGMIQATLSAWIDLTSGNPTTFLALPFGDKSTQNTNKKQVGEELLLLECALWHLLKKDYQAASETLEKVVKKSRDGIWHVRNGIVQMYFDHHEAGLASFELACKKYPQNCEIRCNKAAALARLKRYQESLQEYEKVLQIDPQHAFASKARRTILEEIGDLNTVIRELRANLLNQPENLEYRVGLFNVLAQNGKAEIALNLIQEILEPYQRYLSQGDMSLDVALPSKGLEYDRKRHQQISLRWLLVGFYIERQNWLKALALINEIRLIQPATEASSLIAWAKIQAELGKGVQALEALKTFSTQEADPAKLLEVCIAQVGILIRTNQERHALELIEGLDEDDKADIRVRLLYVNILFALGKTQEALLLLKELLKIDPDHCIQMMTMGKIPHSEQIESFLVSTFNNPNNAKSTREAAAFAIAKMYDEQAEYGKAFTFLNAAKELGSRASQHQAKQFSSFVDETIRVWSAARYVDRPQLPASDPHLIFIVGMPRSGTTLVESILGAHSAVFAAGELSTIPDIVQIAPRTFGFGADPKGYIESIALLKREQYISCAGHYMTKLAEIGARNTWVSDKLPHNFCYLGLINTLFPKAKILHVRRDPRDTGLSNYWQNFDAKNTGLSYAYKLEDIASHMNDYHRLMEHWKSIGIPMMDIHYEDLVENQEEVSKSMVDYVGLDWQPSMLNFQNQDRAIRTASVSQVRRNVYSSSIGKWRHYETYLDALLKNIDPNIMNQKSSQK